MTDEQIIDFKDFFTVLVGQSELQITTELRKEIKASTIQLRQEIKASATVLRGEIKAYKIDLSNEIKMLRNDMNGGFNAIAEAIDTHNDEIDAHGKQLKKLNAKLA